MAKKRRFTNKNDENQLRINEQIRVPKVRIVGNNFEQISDVAGQKIESDVYDTRQAKKWAEDLGLDLVEINPKGVPPVVKIIDYQKFLYKKKKKEKE